MKILRKSAFTTQAENEIDIMQHKYNDYKQQMQQFETRNVNLFSEA